MCVFSFFRAAVRAFSLACPANYCFLLQIAYIVILANKREREREPRLVPYFPYIE